MTNILITFLIHWKVEHDILTKLNFLLNIKFIML